MSRRAASALLRPLEEDEQRLYFDWLGYVRIAKAPSLLIHDGAVIEYPLRPYCHAVPNQRGSRTAVNNKILKGQGVTAGVCDISVLVPAGHFHGLFIELKRRDMSAREVTEAQWDQIRRRQEMGYQALVAPGFDVARSETKRYLALSWIVSDPYAES